MGLQILGEDMRGFGEGSIVVAVAGARFENNSVRYIVEQAGAGLGGIFYFVLTGWRQPARA